MTSTLCRIVPFSFSIALGLLAACHTETEDVSPELRSQEMSEGRTVSIALPAGVEQDQIQAVAAHVESALGGDVAAAKVKVEMAEPGAAATLVIELWGTNLPDEQSIRGGLQQQFEFLAHADISVESLDVADGPRPAEAHSDAEDPNVARQEIIDQLHEQGVEGDIHVDVEDGPEGRRVEVRVEDTKSDDQK